MTCTQLVDRCPDTKSRLPTILPWYSVIPALNLRVCFISLILYSIKSCGADCLPATQTEPTGHICLDKKLAVHLGLSHLPTSQQQLVAATILSKPVSPCEAAMHMLGIDIVSKDLNIEYISCHPPKSRRRMVLQRRPRCKGPYRT